MQYKGEDLDLRVPQTRATRESYLPDYDLNAGNGRWARARPLPATGGAEPLWVDEVLLACCNYAFDVAQANGAAEVDLEHLVNALTRVDAAARILEARGVHEGQLRRESAALIASEIPAANAGDAIVPRRSPDLEDVLRRASDLARRRGTTAGVDDVLWVLLHYGRDLAVVHLLRRHTPDWQRADWGRIREAMLPPEPQPMPRPVPMVASDVLASRVTGIEDGLRALQSEMAAERKLLADLVRDIQRDIVAQRGDGAAFRGDLGQRLETLERAIQTRADGGRIPAQLTERLASLEKALHTSLGETTRAAVQLGQRLAAVETAVASGPAVAERLAALEKAVGSSLAEVARNGSHIGQRLSAIEASVSTERVVAFEEAVSKRMEALEKAVHGGLAEGARNWAHLGQRLNAFESAVDDRNTASSKQVAERLAALEKTVGERLVTIERVAGESRPVKLPDSLAERLVAIERRVEATHGESGRRSAELAQRVAGIGRLVETMTAETGRVRLELAERFADIEADLAARPAELAGAPREVMDTVARLERSLRSALGDLAVATGQLGERLAAVERSTAERASDPSEALLILDERLGSVERMMEARGGEAASISSQILERLRILEARPQPEPAPAVDVAALVGPLQTRLDGMEGTSAARIAAVSQGLGQIATRFSQLEERLKAEALVTEEALKGRDQDFDFIYAEIKQLGQSQSTLNSAVSDWRNESQTHFGTLADRLEKLQTALMPPEPQPVALPAVLGKPLNGSEPGPAGDAKGAPRTADTTAVAGAPRPVTANGPVADPMPDNPGRGFWYWLFGTDDLARSHRESDIKVARMRQNIRESKERRRG